MYNTNKSLSIWFLVVGLGLFFLTVFISPVAAIDLPFDPNDYTFLVYNPEGDQSSIVEAMSDLGISLDPNRDIRTSSNPVTPNDLATHNILIVGWNIGGDTSGLDANTLTAGITGKIILSGHDLDYHTIEGPTVPAQTMLIQAINYVLQGGGTGLITLGDAPYSGAAFSYLPEAWDVNATRLEEGGEYVTEFTSEGLNSGVFDGLEPNKEPNNMSGWGASYHDIFTIEQGSSFVSFELGGYDGSDIITIARYNILPLGCDVNLTKTDDISGCVEPNDFINYQICWSTGCDINDVNIVDFLPEYVDFISCTDGGINDSNYHTVTWNLGDLVANDSCYYSLRVKVRQDAPQGELIRNTVRMFSN